MGSAESRRALSSSAPGAPVTIVQAAAPTSVPRTDRPSTCAPPGIAPGTVARGCTETKALATSCSVHRSPADHVHTREPFVVPSRRARPTAVAAATTEAEKSTASSKSSTAA